MHAVIHYPGLYCSLLLLAASAALPAADAGNGWEVTTSTPIGVAGDHLVGAAIQSDGTIVVAGRITGGPLLAGLVRLGSGDAVVLRLSPDGRTVRSASAVGAEVVHLTVDPSDQIILALGDGGVAQLDPSASRILWTQALNGHCARVDAGTDGTIVALAYDRDDRTKTGSGTLTVFAPDGTQRGSFRGHRNTTDAVIDSDSATVVSIGWRQTRAHDGKKTFPVQIAYLRGVAYDGTVKYTLYDWPTERDQPGFLNRPENNMADTRGYRLARGADGLIYAGFEVAGGNHIFRYEPVLTDGAWTKAQGKRPKGDQFFEWYNSRSEHKLFIGCYAPATGDYLRGQQFAGRLSSGRTNAVRIVGGALAADGDGQVLVGGSAASGLPLTFVPPDTGDYTGGAYGLILAPNLAARRMVTRLDPKGDTHAVALRRIGAVTTAVLVGRQGTDDGAAFWSHHPAQTTPAPGGGFLTVLTAP